MGRAMTAADRLPAGARLGRYEIVAFVDAGGMGEVYRARDPHLGRVVAIKVLPPVLGADPDRLHRFEVEARAAATVSHPHLLAVYDVGAHEGRPYLVTEWLEGMTLRHRLAAAPMTWREAVTAGVELAEGLAEAHAHGVVHRDIKPENLFLTRTGGLKILDFGLARLAETDMDRTATLDGIVMGTAGYLSPEQASGRPVDHRADIFSAAAVIVEMITHRRAFDGHTSAERLAAVLTHDPLAVVQPRSSAEARVLAVLARCLEKAPERRFESARDLAVVLSIDRSGDVADWRPSSRTPAPATTSRWRLAAVVSLVAMIAAAVYGVGLGVTLVPGAAGAPGDAGAAGLRRVAMALPADVAITYGSPLAFSNDGSAIAVVLKHPEGRRLWWRRLADEAFVELAGTDGVESPVFSPDGHWLLYWAAGQLWKVGIEGGAPIRLTDVPNGPFRGADWNGDVILFTPRALGPLSAMTAAGQHVRAATVLDVERHEFSHRWPQILPGGDVWLYTALSGPVQGGSSSVMVHRPSTGETRELVPDALFARVIDDGVIVFVRNGVLFASRFDAARLRLEGTPVQLPYAVHTRSVSGATSLAASGTGDAIFVTAAPETSRELVWVDGDGATKRVNVPPARYGAPRVSPDGRQVAVTIAGDLGTGDVWKLDLDTGVRTRVTTTTRSNGVVAWSPDGQRLVAPVIQGAVNTLVDLRADGVGTPTELLPLDDDRFLGSWTRDGDVVFSAASEQDPGDIHAISLRSGRVRPVVIGPGTQFGARVSPDGRWLAFVSNESGRFEAFVSPYPSADRRWQVSDGGGQEVVWSADSRRLYFRRDGQILATEVVAGRESPAGPARVLLGGRFLFEPNYPGIPHFDAAPDGRLLMITSGAGPAQQLQLVLGWRSHVRRLLAPAS